MRFPLTRAQVKAAAADTFVLGTTKPIFISPGHASNNVGNKYGVTRTNYAGTINFANGPVNLSNLNVSSLQNMTGAGHQFTNVLFTGSYAGDAGGGQLMATASSVSDLKLDFCEFRPSKPGDRYNGIYGHDFTASRCAIERTVDGLVSTTGTPPGQRGIARLLDRTLGLVRQRRLNPPGRPYRWLPQ